jgi:hypothetical protein
MNCKSVKYSYHIVWIFVLVIVATGCKKDESSSPSTSPTINGQFTCKVNGIDWTANTSLVTTYMSNTLNIAANLTQGTTGEMMTLNLINVTGTGTSTLAGTFGTSYAQFTRTVGTSSETFMTSASSTGTVTITTLNTTTKNIVGTFSFTAKSITTSSAVSVTNGAFNLTYQ